MKKSARNSFEIPNYCVEHTHEKSKKVLLISTFQKNLITKTGRIYILIRRTN